jgi:hypothetical protein
MFILISIYLVTISTLLGVAFSHRHGWIVAVCSVALLLLGASAVIGPGILRQDLRQDLLMTDILKHYPVSGKQILLGEILTPVIILSAFQWLMILLVGCLWPSTLGNLHVGPSLRIAICLGAVMVFPAINMISLTISNATVIIFPAWFQNGKESMRGIETMGQQMILLLGRILVMAISLIPASLLLLGFFALGSYVGSLGMPGGMALGLILGGIAATAILAGEVWFAISYLGKRFDAFDLSSELSERA